MTSIEVVVDNYGREALYVDGRLATDPEGVHGVVSMEELAFALGLTVCYADVDLDCCDEEFPAEREAL
jgi:hypothetical protein